MTTAEAETKDGFVTLRIEDDLKHALERMAKAADRSRSAEIRIALRTYAKDELERAA